MVLFGTRRLRNVGSDLGAAIKNFRGAIKEGEEDKPAKDINGVMNFLTLMRIRAL